MEERMTIKKLGIVGFGQMGSGIAQVSAAAGYQVVAADAKDEYLKKGLNRIEGLLNKAIEKGKATEDEKKKILGNITTTTDLGAFADCDLVIEAIVENLDAKIQVFETLDRVCKPTTIFRFQHLFAFHHRHGGRDLASRPVCRTAFLQSGAGDEAG